MGFCSFGCIVNQIARRVHPVEGRDLEGNKKRLPMGDMIETGMFLK
jgi:hypothetical protein